ncbi:MAG: PAS domain S-box protein, partial [Gammaproteobacteria bacterium]|nr:PAS domain S-box protein [Gammaproteobacteria bacterium]
MSQESPTSRLQLSERDELLRRIQELEERCSRAEDALRTSEVRNRLLGDSAPFGIIVVESEGHVFGANQKMLNMLAWPSDQDVTELDVLQHPPLVESGVADSFRLCLEKRTRIVSDHSCLGIADGCEHLRYHICPVLEPDGRLSGIIAFVEDITELKLAEETIKASEKKYRLLFESAPVAMIERDAGELKRHLEQLRAEGITDLHSYFSRNPQEVARCMGLIKTVDCNSAFLDLMEAQTRDEIDGG